ncbi:MAG: hypothetical protein UW39_C0006G0013 [Parcubacteria group bacterium GW2011_GWC2_44_17]|uniref:Type II secretion system protein GspF domain-containing protein n=1 Tax=Candidatus Jacksonbacteria bacterium RIFCSPLOWO2_02_FULL_44_20 TaxID=1798460 RepID=A0A1G2A6Z6_9BACT|nr:MAG: hypothetical protein UW39_C0006G0013 [Parcubacteria group bacterium GW2011_GWC2_44_17]KKT50548.1 MAG: hypothetical protein UW40_C0002G0008 [Parcubacteria group bacterium GW2011_GWF2_44_17]OGY70968.1 MAG: hypothetical protein A3C00_02415 [Candidatus Jacksonbacteria bacterium RIFCSPHIGHO2_02_FULL_44_25]OGY71131.1 MAG: hypothetical protein A3E05_04140 [Candidatus Jacksonbacteria bacterium RIFCSPHIGHO2_12_FULL_44_12]OGY72673.1 MAG: hypothetical protein A3H61_01625 [Candidatus Jacksonbacteri
MNFSYEALNNQGAVIKGIVEALTKTEAIALIEEKGFTVARLSELKTKTALRLKFLERVTVKDMVAFYRQLSLMISSDIPIVQALKIISTQQMKNLKMREILSDVYENVNEGMKCSDALARYSSVFGDFYIYMIKSGEASGKFNEVLDYLADQQEKDYEFRSKIKGAMTYPIFILTAILLMGFIMMIFVIPKLTAMLVESGIPLPITTRFLIFTSDTIKNFWYLILTGIVGAVVGFRLLVTKNKTGRNLWHRAVMLIPNFGPNLVQKTYLVRMTKSLALLIIGGVPLTEAIQITSSVVGNVHYQAMLKETAEAVKDGNTIGSVFAKYPYLVPDMLTQMTAIGEQTGKVDQVFDKIGNFYTKEVTNTVENITKIIEPVIMLLMGGAVGFLVISIMMPMFQASQAV